MHIGVCVYVYEINQKQEQCLGMQEQAKGPKGLIKVATDTSFNQQDDSTVPSKWSEESAEGLFWSKWPSWLGDVAQGKGTCPTRARPRVCP